LPPGFRQLQYANTYLESLAAKALAEQNTHYRDPEGSDLELSRLPSGPSQADKDTPQHTARSAHVISQAPSFSASSFYEAATSGNPYGKWQRANYVSPYPPVSLNVTSQVSPIPSLVLPD
jgi:hypothetical protein